MDTIRFSRLAQTKGSGCNPNCAQMRTALTALGMIIGVSSVIVLIAVGQLARVVDVGRQEQVERGAVQDLRVKAARRSIGDRHACIGVLRAKRLDEVVEGEAEIRGGRDGHGGKALGRGRRIAAARRGEEGGGRHRQAPQASIRH